MTDVIVPANTWVNVYAETGIMVGVPLSVDNIGNEDVYLSAVADSPAGQFKDYVVCQRGNPERNLTGALGAWVYSPNVGGVINVREVGSPTEFIRDSGATIFEPPRTSIANVVSVNLSATVAVQLAGSNPLRQSFRVDLSPGVTDEEVFIRLYPTAQDNIKQGIVISRVNGFPNNPSFFELNASVSGYTGEISAITNSGAATVFVTEY